MSIGAITVPSFVTNNLSDNNFIIKNCNPKIIILETDKLYTKNKFSFKNENVVAIEKSSKFMCYEKIQEKFNENKKKLKYFVMIFLQLFIPLEQQVIQKELF